MRTNIVIDDLDEIIHALETSDFVELSHDLLISHG